MPEKLTITSPAFADCESIPVKYTADGDNINPELSIEGIPDKAKSLVLIIDDPDAPYGIWTHWIVFNISPNATRINENSVPGIGGINDFKKISYGGPCPPHGEHRYFFRVYALDVKLDFEEGTFRKEIENAMKGHVLAQGELMGTYSRE